MQPAGHQTVVDRAGADAGTEELTARDHAALLACELSDHQIHASRRPDNPTLGTRPVCRAVSFLYIGVNPTLALGAPSRLVFSGLGGLS
jgi:hypothetical protein